MQNWESGDKYFPHIILKIFGWGTLLFAIDRRRPRPQVSYTLGRTEKNGTGGMKTMASALSLMQRLRLSHTKPRLSVMIRNWQCQQISRQTRDLDKSAIVIRLSLFSTNCHFLVWLPLSWAAQEMVYRPLRRLGSGVWKSKVNYWYPAREGCDHHWSSGVRVMNELTMCVSR